jgi:hypothetical protein
MLGKKIAAMIVGFIGHTFRLPLSFFESRYVGDIISRVQENPPHLIHKLLPVVLRFGLLQNLASRSFGATLSLRNLAKVLLGSITLFNKFFSKF